MMTDLAFRLDTLEIQTRRIVEAFVSARLGRDYQRLLGMFHDDARFVLPSTLPLAAFRGECRGGRMIVDRFRQSDALLESYDFELFSPLIEGHRAAARWMTMQRNRGSGGGLLVSGAGFLTQEKGLITEYYEFFDTAAVASLI